MHKERAREAVARRGGQGDSSGGFLSTRQETISECPAGSSAPTDVWTQHLKRVADRKASYLEMLLEGPGSANGEREGVMDVGGGSGQNPAGEGPRWQIKAAYANGEHVLARQQTHGTTTKLSRQANLLSYDFDLQDVAEQRHHRTELSRLTCAKAREEYMRGVKEKARGCKEGDVSPAAVKTAPPSGEASGLEQSISTVSGTTESSEGAKKAQHRPGLSDEKRADIQKAMDHYRRVEEAGFPPHPSRVAELQAAAARSRATPTGNNTDADSEPEDSLTTSPNGNLHSCPTPNGAAQKVQNRPAKIVPIAKKAGTIRKAEVVLEPSPGFKRLRRIGLTSAFNAGRSHEMTTRTPASQQPPVTCSSADNSVPGKGENESVSGSGEGRENSSTTGLTGDAVGPEEFSPPSPPPPRPPISTADIEEAISRSDFDLVTESFFELATLPELVLLGGGAPDVFQTALKLALLVHGGQPPVETWEARNFLSLFSRRWSIVGALAGAGGLGQTPAPSVPEPEDDLYGSPVAEGASFLLEVTPPQDLLRQLSGAGVVGAGWGPYGHWEHVRGELSVDRNKFKFIGLDPAVLNGDVTFRAVTFDTRRWSDLFPLGGRIRERMAALLVGIDAGETSGAADGAVTDVQDQSQRTGLAADEEPGRCQPIQINPLRTGDEHQFMPTGFLCYAMLRHPQFFPEFAEVVAANFARKLAMTPTEWEQHAASFRRSSPIPNFSPATPDRARMFLRAVAVCNTENLVLSHSVWAKLQHMFLSSIENFAYFLERNAEQVVSGVIRDRRFPHAASTRTKNVPSRYTPFVVDAEEAKPVQARHDLLAEDILREMATRRREVFVRESDGLVQIGSARRSTSQETKAGQKGKESSAAARGPPILPVVMDPNDDDVVASAEPEVPEIAGDADDVGSNASTRAYGSERQEDSEDILPCSPGADAVVHQKKRRRRKGRRLAQVCERPKRNRKRRGRRGAKKLERDLILPSDPAEILASKRKLWLPVSSRDRGKTKKASGTPYEKRPGRVGTKAVYPHSETTGSCGDENPGRVG